jgi:hypothetical protein
MVLAGIIFLAMFLDSLRESRLARLKRRHMRVDSADISSVSNEVTSV